MVWMRTLWGCVDPTRESAAHRLHELESLNRNRVHFLIIVTSPKGAWNLVEKLHPIHQHKTSIKPISAGNIFFSNLFHGNLHLRNIFKTFPKKDSRQEVGKSGKTVRTYVRAYIVGRRASCNWIEAIEDIISNFFLIRSDFSWAIFVSVIYNPNNQFDIIRAMQSSLII